MYNVRSNIRAGAVQAAERLVTVEGNQFSILVSSSLSSFPSTSSPFFLLFSSISSLTCASLLVFLPSRLLSHLCAVALEDYF